MKEITVIVGAKTTKLNDEIVGGCALILSCIDDYDRGANRSICIPLGKTDQYEAEMLASKLSFSCVDKKYMSSCKFNLPSSASRMLKMEDGEFTFTANKNREMIEELRKLYVAYGKPTILEYNKDVISDAVLLAAECLKSQLKSDTGTMVIKSVSE